MTSVRVILLFLMAITAALISSQGVLRAHIKKLQSSSDNYHEHQKYEKYIPGQSEETILKNILQTDATTACRDIWKDKTVAQYKLGLKKYQDAINNLEEPVPNLMVDVKRSGGKHDACGRTRLHPKGITGLFPKNHLSFSSSGYIEPLFPPSRTCGNNTNDDEDVLSHLVHDFEAMCHTLLPYSNIVLFDIGASSDFRGNKSPLERLLDVYERMGFIFDHIYAFEETFEDPKKVYGSLLPEKYIPSYHWINVGISSEQGSKMNPLHSILKKFTEDDLIVVKFNLDTSIGATLARQLLEDDAYSTLIGQFYGTPGNVTASDSLELFSKLREAGIPAHYLL